MCGRFSVAPGLSAEEIAAHFEAVTRVALSPRYNVAPSQPVPVLRAAADGGRELVELRWGLVPHWAKSEKVGFSNINARVESVARSPAFRDAFARRRCVVLATGFYEWRPVEGRRAKQPFNLRRADGRVMPFAAVWDVWQGPDGRRLESCAIITTQARGVAARIHDRMPLVLRGEDVRPWLDAHTSPREALGLLARVDAEALEAQAVSTLVNSPKNDGPECLAPVAQ